MLNLTRYKYSALNVNNASIQQLICEECGVGVDAQSVVRPCVEAVKAWLRIPFVNRVR